MIGVWRGGVSLLGVAFTGVGFPRPIFVTGGWGIGLAMDAYATYWDMPPTEQEVNAEVEKLKQQR